MAPIQTTTAIIKLEQTPVTITNPGTLPSAAIPASTLVNSKHLKTYRSSHKRFTLSWIVFKQHLVDHHEFDPANDMVVYAVAPSFEAKTVRNEAELNAAFRAMRGGRGGVGFWVVGGGVLDSKQPIAREEYLGEAFSDGEDDQELSDGEEERVKKWQKGLAKAKAPRETITTYQ